MKTGRYLVDVGFGGQTLSSPIRLETDTVQQTRHEPYRIREHGDGLVLESEIRDTWEPLYLFSTRPFPMIDRRGRKLVRVNVSGVADSSPACPSRSSPTTRAGICGAAISPFTARVAASASASIPRREVVETLTERFGIDLTGLGDVEARVKRGAGQLTTVTPCSGVPTPTPARRAPRRP